MIERQALTPIGPYKCSGTSRHFAAAQQFGGIWSEADINHREPDL